jgi:phosphoglycolate phosphatase
MKPFDLVLFDLDGTLVETAPEICDAVNDTLAQLGLNNVTQGQVNDWIGHGTLELLIQALGYVQQLPAQHVRQSPHLKAQSAVFQTHYRARCGTRSQCYPHVIEALTHLKAKGVRLGVVTNKEGAYTRTVLDAHGLTPLLDRIVSGDTFPSKKPSPQGVQSCIADLGVRADKTLFVGDSSIDIATARAAGVAAWAVPYGYNMGQPIASSSPDRLIPDFSVFLDWTS